MLTFILVILGILATGTLSYFTSTWFGTTGSNSDKLPSENSHHQGKLKKSSEQ